MGQLDTIAMPQSEIGQNSQEKLDDQSEIDQNGQEADFPELFDIIEMESNMNKIQALESYVNELLVDRLVRDIRSEFPEMPEEDDYRRYQDREGFVEMDDNGDVYCNHSEVVAEAIKDALKMIHYVPEIRSAFWILKHIHRIQFDPTDRTQLYKGKSFLECVLICLAKCRTIFKKYLSNADKTQHRDLRAIRRELIVDCYNGLGTLMRALRSKVLCIMPNYLQEPSNEPCLICYESTVPNLKVKTSCNHIYHLDCIRKWVAEHNNCPACRMSFNFNGLLIKKEPLRG